MVAVAGRNLHVVTNFAKRIDLIPSPPAAEDAEGAGDETEEVANDAGGKSGDPPKVYGNFKALAQDEKVTAVYVNCAAPDKVKVAQDMLNAGNYSVDTVDYCTHSQLSLHILQGSML